MKSIPEVIEGIKKFDKEITYDTLREFVSQINLTSIDYSDYLPEIVNPNKYERNVLIMHPIECVLFHWPARSKSAIHLHNGFWGLVSVLKGEMENVDYEWNEDKKTLTETHAMKAIEGGVLYERNYAIHKIENILDDDSVVTLHFYAPPIDSLVKSKLYDTNTGKIAVLNEHATSASWEEDESCFESVTENAFQFVSYEEYRNNPSHRVYTIVPKPNSSAIDKMTSGYYEEQAKKYDLFDLKHETRRKYQSKINELIVEDLKSKEKVGNVLSIACGTGRRISGIKEKVGKGFDITGYDLSEEMCNIASDRGINAVNSGWLNASVEDHNFDAATYLYAFGHVTNEADRLHSLKKIYNSLTNGGALYLDVFNLNDKNEWGPKAQKNILDNDLLRMGYELGDVFYKKTEGEEIAYLHYFSETEIISLLEKAGFKLSKIWHIGYVKKSGEILDANDEGALFVKALKN